MMHSLKISALTGLLLAGLAWTGFARCQEAVPPVPAPPQLGASSYMLVDFDSGRVLASYNTDLRVEPASITKIMTSYIVFTELAAGNIQLDDVITVSEKAWRTGGSRMYIEVDTQVGLEPLIKGMVIQSGNDASVALAEYIAGSEPAFADLMNHYADQLGMANTHYTNSTGLPDGDHYTTAADVAILSAALIREFPEYYRWYSEREYTYNNIRQHNRNTLLWRDPAVDGIKTGHTDSAGYCLVASARRENMRLISVVMGSASEQSRTSESQALLNYGFRFFETHRLYERDMELAKSRVWKGLEDELPLGLAEDLFVTIPRGRYDQLDAEMRIDPRLQAPIPLARQVGELRVTLSGEQVVKRPLVALKELPQGGFLTRTIDGLKLWASGFFGDEE